MTRAVIHSPLTSSPWLPRPVPPRQRHSAAVFRTASTLSFVSRMHMWAISARVSNLSVQPRSAGTISTALWRTLHCLLLASSESVGKRRRTCSSDKTGKKTGFFWTLSVVVWVVWDCIDAIEMVSSSSLSYLCRTSLVVPLEAFVTARRAELVTSGSESCNSRCTRGIKRSSTWRFSYRMLTGPPNPPCWSFAGESPARWRPTSSVNISPAAVASATRTEEQGSFWSRIAAGRRASSTLDSPAGITPGGDDKRTISARRGTHKTASPLTRSSESVNNATRTSMMTLDQ
mmetsp:Transcript_30135/g.64598  ORF Transcript_30135/g.64598 Transcript_30135/m.64598 type:complete len:288 (-) Transcript_30135:979-1842(-)